MISHALWAYDIEIDGIYYNLNELNKTAEVTNSRYPSHPSSGSYYGEVKIPMQIEYNSVVYTVTSIIETAFIYPSLSSIEIPNSVISIGDDAFNDCSSLKSINIPQNVTSIGLCTFANCSSLISVTIPNSVMTIGVGAFLDCSSLSQVDLPNNLISIGIKSFYGCTSLSSIKIPNSVTSIGVAAFQNCIDLKTVVSNIENPFPIGKADDSPFSSYTLSNAKLYVPKGTVEKYKETEGWKDFVSIEEWTGSIDDTTGKDPQPTPKCETPTVAYNNGKLQLECNTEGVEYHVSIMGANINMTTADGYIEVPNTYTVRVFASKDGYEDSDEATTTIKADNNMDVNHDGRVDAQDASLIQQYVAGKASL